MLDLAPNLTFHGPENSLTQPDGRFVARSTQITRGAEDLYGRTAGRTGRAEVEGLVVATPSAGTLHRTTSYGHLA